MRDASIAIIREIGVETGGSRYPVRSQPAQWKNGRDRDEPKGVEEFGACVESHGFPIAKIAAKLAVGYTLDEIPNDITKRRRHLRANIDYCVVKVPRFTFENSEVRTRRSPYR